MYYITYPTPPHLHTLSLHDALPISVNSSLFPSARRSRGAEDGGPGRISLTRTVPAVVPSLVHSSSPVAISRSEEHTSELQSLTNLVCRFLLEKKKQQDSRNIPTCRI